MTRQRTARTNSGVLRPLALPIAVLTVLVALAAPAQQMDTGQRPARPPAAIVPAQASTPTLASPHPLLPRADNAGDIAASGSSLSFLSPLSFAAGGIGASSIAVGDVNGDGIPDLVVATESCNSSSCSGAAVSVLLGNGDGSFQPAVSYDLGGLFAKVVLADVNGDGKRDIVAAAEFCLPLGGRSSCASVLLGNGDGTFQPAVTYSSGGFLAASVAVADVNGDGKPDIVVANNCSAYTFPNYDCNAGAQGIIGVLLGNGDGTFQPAVTYSPGGYSTAGYFPSAIAIADVNGDGKPDLIVTNQFGPSDGDGSVGVLLGNGNGTFQPVVTYDSGGPGPDSVAVADVNGDGRPDLLVVGVWLEVLLGNGDGTFQPAVTYDSGGGNSIAVADLNADGKLDVAVGNGGGGVEFNGDGTIDVLLGNGDGTFQPAVTYDSGGYGTGSVVAADVNGDGKTDIVTATQSVIPGPDGNRDGLASVLLNNTGSTVFQTTTLLLSSLNPSLAGQAVTLTAVASSAAGIPQGGEVTFYYYEVPGIVGTASLSGGTASINTSSLPIGTSVITAIYRGSGQYGPSMSPALQQAVNPTTKSVTSTALASSLNPSIYGQKVTWTATVTTSGPATPTGKVNFKWDGYSIGSATLNASGVATLSRPNLNVYTYPLTAVYAGDANNVGSTSAILNQVVKETTSTAALSSSANPSTDGQAVTFTATITSPTVTATGPVTFTAGKTVLGTAQLSNHKATFTTSTLAVGSTTVTATYSGDSNIAESSASVMQTVQP
jgi:hypothetical protein